MNDLQLVTGWLTAFHRETTAATIPAADWIERDLLHGCADDTRLLWGYANEDRLSRRSDCRMTHHRPLRCHSCGITPIRSVERVP